MFYHNHKLVLSSVALSAASIAHQASAVVIEEIAISAQKRQQNMQAVGVSVTAFTDKSLDEFSFTQSTDIASQTPGLNIGTPVGEGNNPSIVLRGVGLNEFSDNNEGPIAVYKDDIYMGSMPGQNFQLFDLERVEVLRGPQGTLYGRNATGGLIHYISRRPTDELHTKIDLTVSEYNQVKFEGALSGPLNQRMQGRVALATNNHDGYVKNRLGADGNDRESWAFRGLLNLDIDENISLLLNAHAADTDNIDPKYQHEVTDPSGVDFWGYADTDGDNFAGDYNREGALKIESSGYSATLNWLMGDMELVSITGWEQVDKFHQEDTDMGPFSGLVPTFAADYEQISEELRLSGSWDGGHWVIGGYYFNSEVEGDYDLEINYFGGLLNALNGLPAAEGGFEGGLDLAGAPFDDSALITFLDYDVNFNQDTESWAVFSQIEYDIVEDLTLSAGLRYTREERDFSYLNTAGSKGGVFIDFLTAVGVVDPETRVVFDYTDNGADVIAGNTNTINTDNLSGKLGLDWHLGREAMLFASVSQGFKSGGFNSGFMDVGMSDARDLFGVTVQYDNETLTSYEIGFKSTLAEGRVRLNATAFYYDYKDFQALSLFDINQFIVNSDASVRGAELELIALPFSSLELQLGASTLDSKVDELRNLSTGELLTDREMVLAPKYTFNGLARYRWKLGQNSLTAQVDFNYQDEHFFDITNKPVSAQEAYTVWNARLTYTSADDLWEVTLFGKNLSDEQYRVYTFDFTGPGGFNQQFFAPPRWLGLKMSYRY